MFFVLLSVIPLIAASICPHQVTQENQEREGTQGREARLVLGVHGETWDPWAQSLTWGTSREAAGAQW